MELRQRQQQRLEIYLNSHTNNCCCCCCLRDVARPNSRRYLSLSCRWFRRWLAFVMAMADCRRRADRATWRLETLAGFLVVCASASALAECAARRCVARADAAAAALDSAAALSRRGCAWLCLRRCLCASLLRRRLRLRRRRRRRRQRISQQRTQRAAHSESSRAAAHKTQPTLWRPNAHAPSGSGAGAAWLRPPRPARLNSARRGPPLGLVMI